MTKTDLVNAVSQKTELSKKDSEKAVAAFISAVSDGLANGENVQIVGFGTFSVTERAARSGRNPATGAPIEIAASKNVRFRVGKALKSRL